MATSSGPHTQMSAAQLPNQTERADHRGVTEQIEPRFPDHDAPLPLPEEGLGRMAEGVLQGAADQGDPEREARPRISGSPQKVQGLLQQELRIAAGDLGVAVMGEVEEALIVVGVEAGEARQVAEGVVERAVAEDRPVPELVLARVADSPRGSRPGRRRAAPPTSCPTERVDARSPMSAAAPSWLSVWSPAEQVRAAGERLEPRRLDQVLAGNPVVHAVTRSRSLRLEYARARSVESDLRRCAATGSRSRPATAREPRRFLPSPSRSVSSRPAR